MVRVRGYTRRSPRVFRRPPSGLRAIIDDVVAGRRSGYTLTGDWRFDVDDPASMERVYDKLGKRHMYVIAETNIPLSVRESGVLPGRGTEDILVYGPHGVGLWRDDDGTVYMDDVHVWVNLLHPLARGVARELEQKFILYVNGRTRTHKFVEV